MNNQEQDIEELKKLRREEAARNKLAKKLKKEAQRKQGNKPKPKKPKYLPRKEACFSKKDLFTKENDHNPIVQKLCPKCKGNSRWSTDIDSVHSDYMCIHCRGVGSINEPSKLFEDEKEIVCLQPNEKGWIDCPNCNRRFKPSDPNVWSGWRHLCGQRIKIEENTTNKD